MTTLRRLAPALVVALSAGRAWAQSCAMCGSSFGENDPVSRAFSWSILFMMATPYTVVGLIGAFLFFNYRRAGRRRAAVIDLRRASRLLGRPVPAEDSGGDLS
jgi:branched-subunit amino acid ABC-type transport system permease component